MPDTDRHVEALAWAMVVALGLEVTRHLPDDSARNILAALTEHGGWTLVPKAELEQLRMENAIWVPRPSAEPGGTA